MKTGYFSFSMGQINFKNKRAFIADLRHLEGNRNITILGVIGYSILKDYEVMLDYAAKKLTFYYLDKKGNRLSAAHSYVEPSHIIPLKMRSHFACLEVTVGKEQFSVALDTGAGLNVMDSRSREKIVVDSSDTRQANVRSFGKQKIRSTTALVEGVLRADIPYPAMRTQFKSMDQHNEHITGNKLDGLFGDEFLHHYRTALNFKKKEFSIWMGDAKERLTIRVGE